MANIQKIIGIAAILIGVIILIYIFIPKTTDCKTDKICFVEKANECKKAVLRDTIVEGTTVKYTTKNCILTKTIEEFSEAEPEEVTTFFKDKEMACPYTKTAFDASWIEGLSFGIEQCEGQLKDAILELRLAQLIV